MAAGVSPTSRQTEGVNGGAQSRERTGSGNTGWEKISTETGIFNVMDFGAKGDNVTNDSAAIQAAVTAASALVTGGLHVAAGTRAAGGTGYSTPAIYFPRGRYKIVAPIDPGSVGLFFSHDKAILIQDNPAADIIYGETFRLWFRNLSFVGGRNQISLTNANVDTTQVVMSNCEFHASAGAAINARASLVSATMTIEHCYFLRPKQVISTYCDKTTFRDCWVFISKSNFAANTAAFLHTRGELIIDNCQLVPTIAAGGARVVNARWIDAYGSLKCINGTRFGGEDAGMGIVWWYAAPAISYPWQGPICVFRDCSISAGAAADPASGVLHLRGAIPQTFIYDANSSLVGVPMVVTTAIKLSTYLAALPSQTRDNIRWYVPDNSQSFAAGGLPAEMAPYRRPKPF